jgi:hypothetical protein
VILFSVIILVLPCVSLPECEAESKNDWAFNLSDPKSDVDVSGSTGHPDGYDDADILEVSSYPPVMGNIVEINLRVNGIIEDNISSQYVFLVSNGGHQIFITYTNGSAESYDFNTGEPRVYPAKGGGTSTLTVTIPERDLGSPQDFSIEAMTNLWREDYYLADFSPDDGTLANMAEPPAEIDIWISSPTDGAAVHGAIVIEGRTEVIEYWEETVKPVDLVEVSFDGDHWIKASTSDMWSNWSLEWDTTTDLEGRHTITARAISEDEIVEDEIVLFVDQSLGKDKPSTGMAKLFVGDSWNYRVVLNLSLVGSFGEAFTATGNAKSIVTAEQGIEVNGMVYDTFTIDSDQLISLNSPYFTAKVAGNATSWILKTNLSEVKSYSVETSTITYSLFGMSDSETTTMITESVYRPPVSDLQFPLVVGETKVVSSNMSYSWTETNEGETDSGSETIWRRTEVLRTEKTEVRAGTFDTFVVRVEESYLPFNEDSYYESYSLIYYSPKVGGAVKTETFTWDRAHLMTMELVSYYKIEEDTVPEPPTIVGFEIGFIHFLVFFVILTLLVLAVVSVRRRNRPSPAGLPTVKKKIKTRVTPEKHVVRIVKPPPKKLRTGPRTVMCPKCAEILTVTWEDEKVECLRCGTKGKLSK